MNQNQKWSEIPPMIIMEKLTGFNVGIVYEELVDKYEAEPQKKNEI